jgi:hypothetical protein
VLQSDAKRYPPGGGGGGGGGGATVVTVTVAEPDWPSEVAVMAAVPALTPVTRPPTTVATAIFELDQATTRPVSKLLLASRSVAVSVTV